LDFFALLHVVKVKHILGVVCTVVGALVCCVLACAPSMGRTFDKYI
jgi:hypothetical protein